MRSTALKQSKWWIGTIFTAALVGAAASVVVVASGCEGTDGVLNCDEVFSADAGDAGEGGLIDDPECYSKLRDHR